MGYSFESEEAASLNKNIFETIYYASLKKSVELSKLTGPYESFKGSPLSQGIFQFELWGKQPSNRYNWELLRNDVMEYGAKNSMLTALMPTASTSQILGFNECFEPYTSNIYTRRTLAGEFIVINKNLIQKLFDMELWSKELKYRIMHNRGSIKNIKTIPEEIRNIFKTAWDIKQKILINQSADRGPYICQSQSLNLFIAEPSQALLTKIHLYGWSKGLKTGSYYIRSKAASNAQTFTIDPEMQKQWKTQEENNECLMCGS